MARVGFDEAQLPKLVHEEAHPGEGSSGGHLLTVRCPNRFKSKQCSGRWPRPVVHFTTQGMTILKETQVQPG
jgi:hypothetical protein